MTLDAMRALPIAFALLLPACATTVSTVQPADTLPKGDFHASAGMNVEIPITRVVDSLSAAADVSDKYLGDPGYEPTQEEQRALLDATIGLALNAPGGGNDFMFRYGVVEHLDVGARWSTSAAHLDAKWQFLDSTSGWDGAVSLGVAQHIFSGIIFDVLEVLELDDFSRTDVEIPVIFGKRFSHWARFWGGPKLILSRYSVDADIRNVVEVQELDGWVYYYGGFAGGSVGYRNIQLYGELTMMSMVASPVILGEEVDIGGLIVSPSFGIMARW